MVSDRVHGAGDIRQRASYLHKQLTGLMRFNSPCALLYVSRVSPDHFRSTSYARRTASVGLVAHVSET